MRSGREPWVTVTRRVETERPSRTRSTTSSSGSSGVPASTKYACREWGSLRRHGGARREEGLRDRLPAEDAVEATGLADDPEAIGLLPALELECVEQAVEREEDGPLERSVAVARGRHRLGGLGCHPDMASTRRHVGCLSRPRRL